MSPWSTDGTGVVDGSKWTYGATAWRGEEPKNNESDADKCVAANMYEYKVVFEKKSWNDHYTDAQAWGGNLLSITSQAEEDVVSRLIAAQATQDGAHHMWIGGQYKEGSSDIQPSSTVLISDCPEGKFCTADAGTAKYWEWVDGTPWTHANWHVRNDPERPGAEPNNAPSAGYTSEKCVQMSVRVTDGAFDPVYDKNEGSSGNWNDASCPKKFGAVYKRRVPDASSRMGILTNLPCTKALPAVYKRPRSRLRFQVTSNGATWFMDDEFGRPVGEMQRGDENEPLGDGWVTTGPSLASAMDASHAAACYNHYCNHRLANTTGNGEKMPPPLCGGGPCVSDEHARRCKVEWESKSEAYRAANKDLDPALCASSAAVLPRMQFACPSDKPFFRRQLRDGNDGEATTDVYCFKSPVDDLTPEDRCAVPSAFQGRGPPTSALTGQLLTYGDGAVDCARSNSNGVIIYDRDWFANPDPAVGLLPDGTSFPNTDASKFDTDARLVVLSLGKNSLKGTKWDFVETGLRKMAAIFVDDGFYATLSQSCDGSGRSSVTLTDGSYTAADVFSLSQGTLQLDAALCIDVQEHTDESQRRHRLKKASLNGQPLAQHVGVSVRAGAASACLESEAMLSADLMAGTTVHRLIDADRETRVYGNNSAPTFDLVGSFLDAVDGGWEMPPLSASAPKPYLILTLEAETQVSAIATQDQHNYNHGGAIDTTSNFVKQYSVRVSELSVYSDVVKNAVPFKPQANWCPLNILTCATYGHPNQGIFCYKDETREQDIAR